ncbi:MAG: bifunctional phosphopantothenoylcysteine decarboxylase/phosphopantothenate--cysteine ligase CoaBC [Bacillota bacterium]
MMDGKNVIVGVTGSIAAYKAPEIVRWLRKNGARVYVVMTQAATKFISPLTLRELSNHPVAIDAFEEPAHFDVEHIALARLADVFLIAPATADIIGKIASGIADDMLTTTVMATGAKVLICPAMNSGMYLNTIVQANIKKLRESGYIIIEPSEGDLLCGQKGIGHLADLDVIYRTVEDILNGTPAMKGVDVLVTAGGTREFLDPVRFIGNPSTGKMGIACATAAKKFGAKVTLIAANITIPIPVNLRVIQVKTAAEMEQALLSEFPSHHITVLAAAVSDFRPKKSLPHKIKREDNAGLQLDLIAVPDLSKLLTASKRKDQVVVGFAAETGNVIQRAGMKLKQKKLDLIIANDVTSPGSGFASDTNHAALITEEAQETLPLMSKAALGEKIMEKALEIFKNRQKSS